MKMIWSLLVLCLLAGCSDKRADAVKQGSDLRKQAFTQVSENKTKIIDAIIEAYREAEYRRIDLEIDALITEDENKVRELAKANGGMVKIEDAISGARKLLALREKERAAARATVDAGIKELQSIVRQADVDLLIANKLNDAIESYENSGVDVSAAKKAVDEIMDLVAKNRIDGRTGTFK